MGTRADFYVANDDQWPWPWNNSKLTDETYLFKDGKVWRMYKHDGEYEEITTPCYFSPVDFKTYNDDGDIIEPDERLEIFMPDMSDIQNVTYGDRSGLIVVSIKH